MSSAAKVEVGVIYMNAQDAVSMCQQCLELLGHPQPATPIKTNNFTAAGYANNSIKQKKSRAFDVRKNAQSCIIQQVL